MSSLSSDPVRLTRTGRRLFQLMGATLFAAVLLMRAKYRRDLNGRARWLQRTCRLALRALGVQCSATGRAPTNTIVVANHLGYLDVLVLAALSPTVFVAKKEVRDWPVFGWFARLAGTRFIDRGVRADVARVADELAAPLAAGVNVVLFLEGTSSDGQSVLPFKSSLLEPAIRLRLEVKPAAVRFTVPPGHSAREEVCWWGEMSLVPHLANLMSLPRITARVAWGDGVEATGDRKQLAVELRQCVMNLRDALEQSEVAAAPGFEETPRLVEAVV